MTLATPKFGGIARERFIKKSSIVGNCAENETLPVS